MAPPWTAGLERGGACNARDRVALPRRHATGRFVVADRLAVEREALRALPPIPFDAAGRRSSRVPLDGYLKHAGGFYRAPIAVAAQLDAVMDQRLGSAVEAGVDRAPWRRGCPLRTELRHAGEPGEPRGSRRGLRAPGGAPAGGGTAPRPARARPAAASAAPTARRDQRISRSPRRPSSSPATDVGGPLITEIMPSVDSCRDRLRGRERSCLAPGGARLRPAGAPAGRRPIVGGSAPRPRRSPWLALMPWWPRPSPGCPLRGKAPPGVVRRVGAVGRGAGSGGG